MGKPENNLTHSAGQDGLNRAIKRDNLLALNEIQYTCSRGLVQSLPHAVCSEKLDGNKKNKKNPCMKLRFHLPLLLVLVNAGCQNFSRPESTYTEAVADLTNKRAGALKNAGCSIKSINSTAGYLEANQPSSHTPAADASKLQNAPVLLKTYDYASKNGDLDSSVTGYWTGQH